MPALPQNGRAATQADIQVLTQRLDGRFDRLDERLDGFGERLRCVEQSQIEEQAHDDERELMLREQQTSRRWLVGIGVAVALSLIATLSSVAHTLV